MDYSVADASDTRPDEPAMKDVIHVCALSAVDTLIERHRPSHLVTLINWETMIETPADIAPDNHLKLGMNDIAEPRDGLVLVGQDQVESLLAFIRAWDAAREAPLLIHCWAGVSRSTAAAFAAVCALNPDLGEDELAMRLRAASPTATPNKRIVALADQALGREGRMVAAIEAIGRGEMAFEGTPFTLPARFARAASAR
jgi:predicted protein tyrosine phosphatase